MNVLASSKEDYIILLHIRNKAENFSSSLVTVYGASREEFKAAFLCQLVNLAKDNPYSILIGGNFNLLRYPHEKRKIRFDH
jgi:hypothetical protein